MDLGGCQCEGERGGIRLEKKFSTGNWMNSLWKVYEFALEIG